MRVGIVGGGQLGQMLGFAGRELGIDCVFIDPGDAPPAAQAGDVIQANFDDADALARLAADCDVLTYEFENVPVDALEALADDIPVYPPPVALRAAQDRLPEKSLFVDLDIPVPGFAAVSSRDELAAAVDQLGLPAVVKTRRFGYDGKGQFVIRSMSDVDAAWSDLGDHPLIVEAWVPFDREVSVIGARNPQGETVVWPLAENVHRGGILRTSRALESNDAIQELAHDYIRRLLDHLGYVGALALELFVVNGELLANEFAPRVHNSGHWTIEGAETSQFANHLLTICGKTPGGTALRGLPAMVNLIGQIPDVARGYPSPPVYLHDYGKTPREGRKLGHLTMVLDTPEERDSLLHDIDQSVTQST